MSAVPGVLDSLSRAGIALILHVKDRAQPLYVDVVVPLRFGRVVVRPWGWAEDLTVTIDNVRSATSPDLGYREYREIRARQREAFERETFVELDDLTDEERTEETARREEEERAPSPRTLLPATPRGGCDD